MSAMSPQNELERLRRENQRLHRAVEELSFLNELAVTISSTQSIDRIVDTIVQKCVRYFRVEQGAVMLLDEKNTQSPFHTMVRRWDDSHIELLFRLDAQLTGWMLKRRQPLLINDLSRDQRFTHDPGEASPIHSLLAVPMVQKGRMTGVLSLFNKTDSEGFSREEQRLLGIIALQSAQVIETARLYREEQNLRLLERDMQLAREIQLKLLPDKFPDIPGYQIAGKNIPAQKVGGDYYDFVQIASHRYGFCLGDVSGKGLPAALLMANLQASLRGQILSGASPAASIRQVNRMMHWNTDPQKFATLFYGILDTDQHQVTYCNAGHDNPFWLPRSAPPRRLNVGGPVVGFLPECNFQEARINLQPGDILLIYSDGITEAFNLQEEEFGEGRLQELVQANRGLPASQLMGQVFRAVHEFSRGKPQMDDQTLLIIKRVEGA